VQHSVSRTEQVSSSQRPVPLIGRSDLVIELMPCGESLYAVVKDPVGLTYHRLQPEQYEVFQRLDGRRSLMDMRDDLQRRFPAAPVTCADIQALITDLHEKGLVIALRLGQGEVLRRRSREKWVKKARQALLNPLYIRLPGWDPDRSLTALLRIFGWIYRPWAVAAVLMFVAASLIFLAVRFDDIAKRLPEFQQFFSWPNLAYLWLTLAVTKILHEFGHGLTCKYFGAECHGMGVMMLVFSPTMYCDVTDSWMLRNKWRRIAIAAAGMYVEVFLAACAIFLWWGSQPGLFNHLCLNVFFVSTVTTVIFNANPLMRYDGYYMLSDFLEIPNLRQKASRMFQEVIAKHCLGSELPPDPFMPAHGRGWFMFYAIATTVYQFVILFGITLFLYTVLKPYHLQSLGITMAVVSLAGTIGTMLWSLYKLVAMPRQEPHSKLRLTATVVVLGGFLTAAVMVPIPWYAEAPFTVEPEQVEHVYAMVPGVLIRIEKRPGDWVRKGDVIAELRSDELSHRLRELVAEQEAHKREIETYRALDRPRDVELAEQHLSSLEEERAEAEEQVRQCRITAPVDGVIVAAPRQPRPPVEQQRERLGKWTGTPLEPDNLGCTIEARTPL